MSEKIILKQMILIVADTGNIIDKATSWAMTGVGATILLILSNIKDVTEIFGKNEVQILLWLLLASLVFGAIEKILFVSISQGSYILKKLDAYLSTNKNNHAQEDINNAWHIIKSRIMRWYDIKFKKDYSTKEAKDNNDMIVDLGRKYNLQVESSILMIVMIVSAVIYVIVKL